MFIDTPPVTQTEDTHRAVFVLTPTESKRLIGRAVAALPEVKNALAKGRLLISGGTTNAYVAEELLGLRLPKFAYTIGVVTDGLLTMVRPADRFASHMLEKGQSVQSEIRDFLKGMARGDVIIKGANAVDPEGNAGVLAANDTGGTIGAILGISSPRGLRLITPVGLEKLIPSVIDAARGWGQLDLLYSTGLSVALMPVVNSYVVTEIQALAILAGVHCRHVASGGVGGSEGSVVILAEGSEQNVRRAIDLVKSLKGEPPIAAQAHHLSAQT